MPQFNDSIRAVIWENGVLRLLDQRRLPAQTEYIDYRRAADVAQAIKDMVVRGAPAIGITAAYGVVLAAMHRYEQSPQDWKHYIEEDLTILAQSRPTAVNLFWALDKMRTAIAVVDGNPVPELDALARRIHEDDIAANRKMGELGSALFKGRVGILTHCNTGSLATGGFGTALGVIRYAWGEGKVTHVFADETRPWLQGARLTAWELVEDDIPVTLQAEGAAAHLMKSGKVQWVIVGADRIAANGDTANKIGTYGLAILAKYHGVKFMVVAPSSTIDMEIDTGEEIPIETRPQHEVLCLNGQRVAAEGADAFNPSFDVTPADLIDAIVTERGVVENPNTTKMRALMGV